MHLNGWHKIGIVASVCWFLGGVPWIYGFVSEKMGVSVPG